MLEFVDSKSSILHVHQECKNLIVIDQFCKYDVTVWVLKTMILKVIIKVHQTSRKPDCLYDYLLI